MLTAFLGPNLTDVRDNFRIARHPAGIGTGSQEVISALGIDSGNPSFD